MFGENDHGSELGSNFPNKSSVLSEPNNVTFITTVEENGTRSNDPVFCVDKVALRERSGLEKVEVVESLLEEFGLVVDIQLWL